MTGHTANTGNTRALDTERESQVTHGDLDHGVRVHVCNARPHYNFEIFPFPALKSDEYFQFVTSELWVQSSISFKERMS